MGVVMDMKKYNVLALFTVVFLVACHGELERNIEDRDDMIPMSFYANIETPKDSISTRTVLGGESSDSYRNVLWEYQDEIFVTNGAVSSRFVNVTEGKSEVALLEGELSQASTYYAAYPYGMVKSYSASGFKIELPSVQNYCHDGVSSDSFPMVAKSEGGMFSFLNLCGIFVLRLIGNETISSVTFSGKDISGKDISVAGNGTISMDYSVSPSLLMEESAFKSVTLRSTEGVRLSPTHPTTFHIVLPVGIYNTFTVTITATDGSVMRIESEKALEIKRSSRTSAVSLSYSKILYLDLNESGETANSYIVNSAGDYKFKAVKGNSRESVGAVSSAEVLWESFGTDVIPSTGDLIRNVSYSDGYIRFSTPSIFNEGNAVIAAKDAYGTILWSWHIWLTDQPQEQIYYNNAGIMMDRNLGATSATPGEVGALGLLYQWGRKDPFLGSSNISANIQCSSSAAWPNWVDGWTMSHAIENPMTYVRYWYNENIPTQCWMSEKTMYDPCPIGWRVPDDMVWKTAMGSYEGIITEFDDINRGVHMKYVLGSDEIWYPAAGDIYPSLNDVGNVGVYWSVTSNNDDCARYLILTPNSKTYVSELHFPRAYSVRCYKESISDPPTPPEPTPSENEDLSLSGTANCYIISAAGDYRFKATKGNSSESVGAVSSAELLWESFGTDVTPSVGDLVKSISYSDGYIHFSTPSSFKEGNAVIAVKDESGIILWSWHIWLTDDPEEQVYFNEAGVMMDRNLGATSVDPGDVTSLGLLYQWGRKDPFLGSARISGNANKASSSVSWPEPVFSTITEGTILYTVNNPMTFIRRDAKNKDWYFTGTYDTDNTRWMQEKTMFDPCPSGWKVPNGGELGIWRIGWGSVDRPHYIEQSYLTDVEGMFFSGKLGNTTIWYPASGYLDYYHGTLADTGYIGKWWSVTPAGTGAYCFYITESGSYMSLTHSTDRAEGLSVRCMKGY